MQADLTRTVRQKFRSSTSQLPILNNMAGKLEAFILSLAFGAALAFVSFLLPWSVISVVFSKIELLLLLESVIWIKSSNDGLFLRRKPKGLGSSSGLYCEGGTFDTALNCWKRIQETIFKETIPIYKEKLRRNRKLFTNACGIMILFMRIKSG